MSRLLALSANSAWNLLNFRRGLLLALLEQGYAIAALIPAGQGVAELERMGVIVRTIALSPRGLSPATDLRLLGSYWRQLGQLKPAAFLGFTAKPNIYGSIAAHRRGIPVIANITGLGTGFLSGRFLEVVLSGLYRAALAHAECVFFHNSDDRELFLARGLVKASSAQVIPGSGVNLDYFAVEPPAGNPAPHFLFIGRFLKDKGITEFVEAARKVKQVQPNARFTALGTVEPHPKAIGSETVEQWRREQFVEFVGSADDVRPFIAQSDCVVLPSYREGLPRALLEASAMARAVIGADVPGCRSVVEDGRTGFLCAPRSASSLAATMLKFAKLSPDRRISMGLAARRKAELEFGEQRVIDWYIAALERILGDRTPGNGGAQ